MSDNNVEVKFGAETGPLKSGVEGAASSVEAAINRMSGAFAGMASALQGHTGAVSAASQSMATGVTGAFEKAGAAMTLAMAPLVALTALLAGGKFFSDAVDETKKFTGEALKLSRALGITVDEAARLNIALGDIYVSTDTYIGASTMLTRQLRTNEDGLRDLGVQTRDANGQLLPMQEILTFSLKVLNEFKEGTDRNIAAQAIFGRGAADAMQLLKLNVQVLEEARQKQEALGLTVSQENVEAYKRYKAALNDAGDVMLAIKKTIGDALMPVLTELGEWFASTGPQRIEFMRVAMRVLVTAINMAVAGFEQLMTLANATARTLYLSGMAVYEFFSKLAGGDFAGAKVAATARFAEIRETWSKAAEDMVGQGQRAWQRIGDAWSGKSTPVQKPSTGQRTMGEGGNGDKAPSRMGQWEVELMDRKVANQKENDLREMSKQQEMDYWSEIRNRSDLTKEEMLALSRKVAQSELDILKEHYQTRIARMNDELEGWRYNQKERLALAERMAAEVARHYDADSRQAIEAQKKVVMARRALADQEKAIAEEQRAAGVNLQLAEIGARERDAQMQVSLGLMTNAELLAQQTQFEEERNAIKYQALMERKATLLAIGDDMDPVAYQKLLSEIQALEISHQQEMQAIRGRSAQENAKYTKSFKDGMESGMTGVLQNFMKGTMSITSLMRGMAMAVLDAFTNMLAKFVVNQIMNSALVKSIKIGEATTVVGANAAEAATGAAASVAPTPFVGPALAASAYAGTLAMAMGAMSLFSARDGFDVPAGVNPLTQLHEREMVLPAAQADAVRNLGGGEGGATGVKDVHFHVQAMDGDSVKRFFNQHKVSLMESIRAASRNGTQLSNSMKFGR
ncbi:hypothetical protein [Limnohabitans sp.]